MFLFFFLLSPLCLSLSLSSFHITHTLSLDSLWYVLLLPNRRLSPPPTLSLSLSPTPPQQVKKRNRLNPASLFFFFSLLSCVSHHPLSIHFLLLLCLLVSAPVSDTSYRVLTLCSLSCTSGEIQIQQARSFSGMGLLFHLLCCEPWLSPVECSAASSEVAVKSTEKGIVVDW